MGICGLINLARSNYLLFTLYQILRFHCVCFIVGWPSNYNISFCTKNHSSSHSKPSTYTTLTLFRDHTRYPGHPYYTRSCPRLLDPACSRKYLSSPNWKSARCSRFCISSSILFISSKLIFM